MSLVSVGVGLEGLGIDDSLVVHQLVTFVIGEGIQLVVFWVPDNVVAFDDLGLPRVPLRFIDFLEDVLAHDTVIQLGFAFAVETKTPHFAFYVTMVGLVAVILGTTRHEFFNVVVGIQFTGKLAEVIAQDRVGLPLVFQEDDGVGVVVQDTFP